MDNPGFVTFGTRLRQMRRAAGLTQEGLAERADSARAACRTSSVACAPPPVPRRSACSPTRSD